MLSVYSLEGLGRAQRRGGVAAQDFEFASLESCPAIDGLSFH
jgi:hypothetical protein